MGYPHHRKPGGYGEYAELLAHLIRDVRKNLSAPKLPFVIGVMGIGGMKEGEKPPQMYLRQAQVAPAALPEFNGNVFAVQTPPFWDAALREIELKLGQVHQMAPLLRGKDKNNANADGSMDQKKINKSS